MQKHEVEWKISKGKIDAVKGRFYSWLLGNHYKSGIRSKKPRDHNGDHFNNYKDFKKHSASIYFLPIKKTAQTYLFLCCF